MLVCEYFLQVEEISLTKGEMLILGSLERKHHSHDDIHVLEVENYAYLGLAFLHLWSNLLLKLSPSSQFFSHFSGPYF